MPANGVEEDNERNGEIEVLAKEVGQDYEKNGESPGRHCTFVFVGSKEASRSRVSRVKLVTCVDNI